MYGAVPNLNLPSTTFKTFKLINKTRPGHYDNYHELFQSADYKFKVSNLVGVLEQWRSLRDDFPKKRLHFITVNVP